MGSIIRLARPRQWTKNSLVLAVPLAAGALSDRSALIQAVLAVIVFTLVSIATYCLNDVVDVERDRAHATKRHRPVASGEVSIAIAILVAVVSVVVAVAIAARLPTQFGLVAGGYLIWTTVYSLVLKHLAIVDLLGLGSGFVLRALAGAAVVQVRPSSWFLLTVASGSIVAAAGKRLAELRAGGDARPVNREYNEPFLVQVIVIASACSLMGYALWALGDAQPTVTTPVAAELTLVPVLYGLLRYLLLVSRGAGESPEDLLLSDRGLLLAAGSFAVLGALAFYA